jgi:hypothetical protein
MDVAPGDLCRIAMALATVNLGGARLFASIARAVVARGDRFQPKELVDLCCAFDRSRYYHSALFELMAKAIKGHCNNMAPRDVLRGMRALALSTVASRDGTLAEVVGDNIPKKAQSGALSSEELCLLAWCFAVLDLHHEKLFRAVFKSLEDSTSVSSETLCQLYEVHLALKTFHNDSYSQYNLEDVTVQGLRAHYKKSKGANGYVLKLDRSSERAHSDISSVAL